MPKITPTQPPAIPEELSLRVQNFDREFQAIQQKYMLRAVSQVVFPGGAVLSVPITVQPMDQLAPAAPSEQATKPE